jgi:hypothetical protein
MKIGDKIYCIKEYSNDRLNQKFEVGKIYTIDFIVDFYRLDNHSHKVVVNNVTFDLLNRFSWSMKFNDYFIMNKEYRKQKLKKLYECNLFK